MKPAIRKILLKFHFITLAIAIVNTIFKKFSPFSLEHKIEFGLEIFVACSGLLLFFFFLKPFKKINFYFLYYPVSAFFLIAAILFRNLGLGMIAIVLVYPFIPDEKQFAENGIVISTPFEGIMSMCCSYKITESKLIFFEKTHELWKLNGEGVIDFDKVKINNTADEIEIIYTTGFDNGIKKRKLIKK